MEFELKVSVSVYQRWSGEDYSISKYSYKPSPLGVIEVRPFYRAYDINGAYISRESEKGFSSFEDAKTACELHKLKNGGE